ncbi:MAG: TetR/AcrR family transcriptional regulator [Clostridiales bacterium]|nr:TetR/AcrR family transcriptional regulator [Clostridiales bacterium]
MPPKAKFTKEEIVTAALSIARGRGIEAVTARELGAALGTSARPIFTVFKSMQEVQSEVRKAAMKLFEEYANEALSYTPAFKAVGVQMIKFAMEEPKLFRLLYMQESSEGMSFDDHMKYLGSTVDVCLEMIQRDYEITPDEARILFRQVWIFTFGICVLCAAKTCYFTNEEITEMLSREFTSMLMLIKSGKLDSCKTVLKQNKE